MSYNYKFGINFDTEVQLTGYELAELGQEIIMASESWLKVKRHVNGVNGSINVYEGMHRE